MAKYNTIDEVIAEINKKYINVDRLSRIIGEGCIYRHTRNGVGCAIGCLLDSDKALQLDTLFENNTTISCLYNDYYTNEFDITEPTNDQMTNDQMQVLKYVFEDVFDMTTITINELSDIQHYHDRNDTVNQFLSGLNIFRDKCQLNKE
jgi:hypothetical protein